MISAIEEAVRKAERVQSLIPEIEVLSSEIAELEIRKVKLKDMLPGLLPIESEASNAIYEESSKVSDKIHKAVKKKEHLEALDSVASKYLKLSLEPLRERNKEGFPKLVIFSLESSEFILSARDGSDYIDMKPELPYELKNLYNDVHKPLNLRREQRGTTVQLKCKFRGMIPVEVKKKIEEAKKIFDEKKIFVIAEMKEYKVDQFIPIPKGDPLVVGFHPIDNAVLWLIADFDTTPVEEAMIFTKTE